MPVRHRLAGPFGQGRQEDWAEDRRWRRTQDRGQDIGIGDRGQTAGDGTGHRIEEGHDCGQHRGQDGKDISYCSTNYSLDDSNGRSHGRFVQRPRTQSARAGPDRRVTGQDMEDQDRTDTRSGV